MAQEPTLSDAHYLMGIAKIGLKNWAGRPSVSRDRSPEGTDPPDPKARLA